MAGRFDLAGVGPGDPELMTIKTMRAIKACQILVLPIGSPELKKPELEEGEEETFAKECLAYRIACEAEPETKKKLRLYLPMPMIKGKKLLKEIHDEGARKAAELLEKGKNLVFLTLGDPTVYSTGIYIYKRLKKMGYQGEIFSGIPSFCAVAARLEISLAENRQELHVLPASYGIEEKLKLPGTKVLMKTGKKMAQVKAVLKAEGQQAKMVMNCGLDGEKIYKCTEEIPEDAGYFSIVIAKEKKNDSFCWSRKRCGGSDHSTGAEAFGGSGYCGVCRFAGKSGTSYRMSEGLSDLQQCEDDAGRSDGSDDFRREAGKKSCPSAYG